MATWRSPRRPTRSQWRSILRVAHCALVRRAPFDAAAPRHVWFHGHVVRRFLCPDGDLLWLDLRSYDVVFLDDGVLFQHMGILEHWGVHVVDCAKTPARVADGDAGA